MQCEKIFASVLHLPLAGNNTVAFSVACQRNVICRVISD